MATVAVIPARAGSKGLPGKHLRLLGGEPLIQHTIRAALAASRVDRVLVSTNDATIASVARRAGAEVPFLRPDELALDTTPTLPVIQHAVAWLEGQGWFPDLVATLQATTPLREPGEIDAAIALLDDPAVASAVTVAALPLAASVVGVVEAGRFLSALAAHARDVRRQAVGPAMRITGGAYVTRRSLLAAGRLLDDRPAALVVDAARAIDIDDLADLRAARLAWRGMA